jgi:hypothetical protein
MIQKLKKIIPILAFLTITTLYNSTSYSREDKDCSDNIRLTEENDIFYGRMPVPSRDVTIRFAPLAGNPVLPNPSTQSHLPMILQPTLGSYRVHPGAGREITDHGKTIEIEVKNISEDTNKLDNKKVFGVYHLKPSDVVELSKRGKKITSTLHASGILLKLWVDLLVKGGSPSGERVINYTLKIKCNR